MRFNTYNLRRAATITDDYGQMKKETYSTVASLPIALYYRAETAYESNPNFSQIDYIGVYKGPFADFQKQDRLNNDFEIVQAVPTKFQTILFLKKI